MKTEHESLGVEPFVCPRGHRHWAGSAFCTVCGAGPVLLDDGGVTAIETEPNADV